MYLFIIGYLHMVTFREKVAVKANAPKNYKSYSINLARTESNN